MNGRKNNNGWQVFYDIMRKIFHWIGWALILIPLGFYAICKGILAASGYNKRR